MERLMMGSTGPETELLQSTLRKAGYGTHGVNGIFGEETSAAVAAFQKNNGLIADGVAGRSTWNALMPYLFGNDIYTVQPGDSIFRIAGAYGTTVARILAANPEVHVEQLRPGQKLIVPFTGIVPEDVSYTYALMQMNLRAFTMRYPFLEMGYIGRTGLLREIPYVIIGTGGKQVFYCAAHHANEWITTPLLMKFIEEFSDAYVNNTEIFGFPARELYEQASIYLVPMVNPDGVDLVTGAFAPGSVPYEKARQISENYPAIPFPEGWKANIEGIDLNLQYPAQWELARENKFRLGFTSAAPRDFVGDAPLTANESRAVYEFTRKHDFRLILTYHTQGNVIYWKYLDYLPERAYEIGRRFAEASGYELESTPYGSGFAGYKDWFIQQYDRPGYTIEAGRGQNPLPISQFPEIYRDNIGILVLGAVLS